MSNNQCPATSKHKIIFAKCIYFMKKLISVAILDAILNFSKRSKVLNRHPMES